MWLFLSSRLRTWVLLAVAVPVARFVVRRLAARTDPDRRTGRALHAADRTLARVQRRNK